MTGSHLPRVRAENFPNGLDPTRSIAVELCAFRLCEWTTPDVRTADRGLLDTLIREHLLDAHRRELIILGQLAREAGLIR